MFLLYLGKEKQQPKPVRPPCPPPPAKLVANDDLKNIISGDVSQDTVEFCLLLVESYLKVHKEIRMVSHVAPDGTERFTLKQIYDK